MRIATRLCVLPAIALAAGWCPSAAAADPPADQPAGPAKVSFSRSIRPIFQEHCQGCHQPAKPLGGLSMTSFADIAKGGESAEPGFHPGKPDDSQLVLQITSQNG